MIDSILDQPLSQWQTEGTLDKEHIVLSSRIRLARNFKGIAFTNRDKEDALEKVDTMMRRVPSLLTKVDGKSYSDISLDKLSGIEREVLVEKHLVSPNLVEKVNHRSVIISDRVVLFMPHNVKCFSLQTTHIESVFGFLSFLRIFEDDCGFWLSGVEDIEGS